MKIFTPEESDVCDKTSHSQEELLVTLSRGPISTLISSSMKQRISYGVGRRAIRSWLTRRRRVRFCSGLVGGKCASENRPPSLPVQAYAQLENNPRSGGASGATPIFRRH